eukprot:TRINITY_DN13168_c0_g1_i2.p1 TRINITY_DN13168_c0_g1~~TRINITY_DN13168_c0_g1_i2.p1  ORF type:complete len:500 (+),score=82.72 TRINITY_DN13168_c0_g1_i2:182-1681(+)
MLAAALTVAAASSVQTKPAVGDWWFNITTQDCSLAADCSLRVSFDVTNTSSAWWVVSAAGVSLHRKAGAIESLVYDMPYGHAVGDSVLSAAVLRRGAYHFLWVNDVYVTYSLHAAGNIYCHNGTVDGEEPVEAAAGASVEHGSVVAAGLTPLRWENLPLPRSPVLSPNFANRSSWYARQAIPGAFLEVEGTYYVFFCGANYADPGVEAGGRVVTGLMRSTDMAHWEVKQDPVLVGTEDGWDADNVCVNGAVRTPDGGAALSYAGYRFASAHNGTGRNVDALGLARIPPGGVWDGVYTKTAEPIIPKGPSGAWDGSAIHEHDFVRLDNGTYVIFYAACCGDCPGGMCDQGGLALSDDLKTWTKYAGNPVLKWNRDRQRWDAKHRRPRGLNRVGDLWYLMYEGAAFDSDPGSANCTRDSVGLARSKDLLNWETHPLQVSLPWQAGSGFDSEWTGWPRAHIENGTVYMFYAAGGPDMLNVSRRWASTGLRTWNLSKYVDWSV